ncbi:heme biosynthesis protein HemY [Rhizobium sp. TRM95111]|uniref:heme biosynthesis protein HemY n=1 Tax=Rhizobium alarense TaxID=2846851 RepID=UPI001F2DE299|nr:heme biosynthesis protein HemY [Rhizobium alarense]MCF3640017.1 heme biosynthesis protein HemY [Rhizobium alarense]
MIRILVFALLVLALGAGFAWLADRPGELSLIWQGQRVEMSLMVAATLVVSLVAIVMFGWWLVRVVLTSPQAVQRYFRARKRDRGYQALSTGLIAAGAGDAALARRMHARTKGLLSADQEPLIHLLDAQVALIEGRHDEARQRFELMADDPETRELGLRGLYLEARRLGANEAARQYAERAAEKAPNLPWAAEATLEARSQASQWDEAIRLVDQKKTALPGERKDLDRKKAVLLTARAADRLDGNPKGARDDALAALKLSGDLVPAGLIAAQAYLREDNLRKAASILEKLWKSGPHPEVAKLYVRARSGDSATDRLKRARKLEALRPNNPESLLAVAEAALEAREFDVARSKAEAAARLGPREGVFLLLADIEDAETGDQGRIRHWMNQALKAPRDPAWTADGIVSTEWRPVSPVTGRLDAFEWRMPVNELAGPTEEGALARAEEALRTLPPVAVPTAAATPEATVAEAGPEPQPIVVDAQAEEPAADAVALPVVGDTAKPAVERKAEEKVPPKVAAKVEEDGADEDVKPFFGGLPDDPGVKDESRKDGTTGFRLF